MSKHLEVWFQLCTPTPRNCNQKKKKFDPNFKLNKLGNYRAGDMKQRRGQVEVIPGETQPRVDPKPPCPSSQVSIPRGSVHSACGSLCSRRPSFTAWLPQVTSAFRLSSPLRGLSILPLQCLTLPHQHTQMEFIALSCTVPVTKLFVLGHRGFPAPSLTTGT